VLYVATATGGIWKSTNNGVTWKDDLRQQPDSAFGALAIFERDPKIIWAGSGEQNNRQSSSWGGGVYRSTDAGETGRTSVSTRRAHWTRRARPRDPNVAYVAAAGNLWTGNAERGVFKTRDAGRTWTKVLYVDTFTGATDIVMDPRDANVLYAATYQRCARPTASTAAGPAARSTRRQTPAPLEEAGERHSAGRQGTHRSGHRALEAGCARRDDRAPDRRAAPTAPKTRARRGSA
jgi:hypothetical protein